MTPNNKGTSAVAFESPAVATTRLRWPTVAALVLLSLTLVARAQAVTPVAAPLPPASAPPASNPPAAVAPAPVQGPVVAPAAGQMPPAVEGPTPAPDASPGLGVEPPLVPRVVPTADASAVESDHDAVVGAWGIEVRPVATSLPVFARRATTGCPLAPVSTGATTAPAATAPASTYDCPPVSVSMFGVRHWLGRNLALNGGVALALGGGSQGDRLLDSYFGFGPSVGVSVLLGNWRHLAVAASPALSFVWFKAAGSADATYVTDLRADLEAELHFGFIGVSALSLGIRSGFLLRLEQSADLTLWSAGISGATTLRGLVSDLTLRYYF